MTKAEGIWKCKVLDGRAGENDKTLIEVNINVEIIEGPSVGSRCTYNETIDGKSALYASYSMKAVGWAGRDAMSLKDDIAAWVERTGGESTVEIKHLMIKNGKKAGQVWDKVSSIGRKPKVLKDPSAERLNDANDALARAMAAANNGGYDDAPPTDDDLPF